MNLNKIKDNKGARYKAKRVGRGLGSGKGKTCGSGYKGQKSRTGVAINGFEGGQMPIHRRLPKRGFTNIFRKTIETISLDHIQQLINSNKIDSTIKITKQHLKELGVINNIKNRIKILAGTDLKTSINIESDLYSARANNIISDLGGNISEPL